MPKTTSGTEKSSVLVLQLFSIAEAQLKLSVSRPTILRLLAHGDLRSIRVGRAVRIPHSSLLNFIEKGGERHIQTENWSPVQ